MQNNLLIGANTTTVAMALKIQRGMGGIVRSLGRDWWKNQRETNVDFCQKCFIPSSYPRATRLISNYRCFTTSSTGSKPNAASASRSTATKTTDRPSSASLSESQTLVSNLRAKILDNNLPWMNQKSKFMGHLSLSEVAGNASFVMVTLSFLNTDILMLRYLAMGGTALSIVFQYYRAVPLWIPIRWNVLLLAINAAMATALIVERREANHMPAELEYLYKNADFEARGFDRVEFYKLFKLGQKVQLDPGKYLTRDGEQNKIL
jgi:Popeye protein conserved region